MLKDILKTLTANLWTIFVSKTYVSHTKPWSGMQTECKVCLSHARGLRWQNLFLVIVESAIQTFTMTNTITFGLIENSKHFCFGRCICQSNPALWWGHLTTIITYIVMSREFQKAHDSCTSVLKSSNARMVDRGSVKLMKLLSIKIRLGLRSELFKIRLPWQRKT